MPDFVCGAATTFAAPQKFLVVSTPNRTGTCTTMLQAQFTATALNSMYSALEAALAPACTLLTGRPRQDSNLRHTV